MERETLRELLEKEKDELTARLQKIDRHHQNRTVSKQFDEQVVDRSNEEVVQNLEVEGREELRAIERALQRLESDQFDACAECGNTISDERLRVIPHTQFCRNCAV